MESRYGALVEQAAYDHMGLNYSSIRRPDPRLAAAIDRTLGDARSVVNVGAGAGSYESRDREILAVEPSGVMIAQRQSGCAPVVQGVAESLPLSDQSFDAAMGVLTLQHWQDVGRGIEELLRVTRKRIVLVTIDDAAMVDLWLIQEYFPEALLYHRRAFPSINDLCNALPNPNVEVFPVPFDFSDGFFLALWGRPEAHLDPRVREASSVWHQLPDTAVARGLEELREDLQSGRWDERHGHLRSLGELDVGLRIVRAEL